MRVWSSLMTSWVTNVTNRSRLRVFCLQMAPRTPFWPRKTKKLSIVSNRWLQAKRTQPSEPMSCSKLYKSHLRFSLKRNYPTTYRISKNSQSWELFVSVSAITNLLKNLTLLMNSQDICKNHWMVTIRQLETPICTGLSKRWLGQRSLINHQNCTSQRPLQAFCSRICRAQSAQEQYSYCSPCTRKTRPSTWYWKRSMHTRQ